MVPQVHGINAGIWLYLESVARDLALQGHDVYVVSGPLFGNSPRRINGRVAVPSGFFKAFYDSTDGAGGGYIVPNQAGKPMAYEFFSLLSLAAVTGIDAFPSAPIIAKSMASPAVTPTTKVDCGRR